MRKALDILAYITIGLVATVFVVFVLGIIIIMTIESPLEALLFLGGLLFLVLLMWAMDRVL